MTAEENEHYTPARYVLYISDLKDVERTAVQKMFNNYSNKNGEDCVLILLSGIAETGLSLMGVNYFYILDYIPGLSQYQ